MFAKLPLRKNKQTYARFVDKYIYTPNTDTLLGTRVAFSYTNSHATGVCVLFTVPLTYSSSMKPKPC